MLPQHRKWNSETGTVMKPQDFLDRKGQEMIVSAIKEAEKNTSGEIRVHIGDTCDGDVYRKAVDVFYRLGMEKTAGRNGVLIYVACNSKVFAIVGDKGINDAVPENFWNDITDRIHERFAKGEFAEGIAEAVRTAGLKLKTFFPYTEDDVNEQSDEISYNETDA